MKVARLRRCPDERKLAGTRLSLPVALQRIARIAFALGALAIIFLSLLPADELPDIDVWDKLEHAIAYATVSLALGIGWAGQRRAWYLLGSGLVVLGVLLEYLQSFVPGRLADPADAVANLVGTLLGLSVVASIGWTARRAGRVGKNW